MPGMIVCAVALILAAEVEPGWEVAREDKKTIVERRPRSDGFMELRATTTTDVLPQAIAEAFWSRRVRSVSAVKQYLVLKKTETEKLVYQQLKLPVVKDRDYTVRLTRYADVGNGLYQFESVCDSDAGPPPNGDHVRVTRCRSHLTIERLDDGSTRVSYTTWADTAGRLPKWIVNLLAPKAAAEFMEKLIDEARLPVATNAP